LLLLLTQASSYPLFRLRTLDVGFPHKIFLISLPSLLSLGVDQPDLAVVQVLDLQFVKGRGKHQVVL